MSGKSLENVFEPVPLPPPFTKTTKGVDYAEMRKKCMETNTPFVDPEFPAYWRSFSDILFYPDSQNRKDASIETLFDIEWKRPKEIAEKPVFISDGPSRFDTSQGFLGDCWFVAAIASLANDEELFKQVVDTTQNFDDDSGIFHFKFWSYGKWIDVVVDDRLPCKFDETFGKYVPVFMQTVCDEFWPALMEKAYAKLYASSYARIAGGFALKAFVDFTGGIGLAIDTNNEEEFKYYLQLTAQRKCHGWTGFNEEKDNLLASHSYAIIDYQQVTNKMDLEVCLVKVYNPHGIGSKEYDGDWADQGPKGEISDKWNDLKDEDTKRLLMKRRDGEYWMSFEYLKANTHRMHVTAYTSENICKILNPSKLTADYSSIRLAKWNFAHTHGMWVNMKQIDVTSFPYGTVYQQFILTVSGVSDAKPQDSKEEDYTVILSMSIKYQRENEDKRRISFSLHKLNVLDIPESQMEIQLKGIHEKTSMLQLKAGKYLIVVADEPFKQGEFLLRARSTGHIDLSDQVPPPRDYDSTA